MSLDLERGFEAKLREAVLDDIEQRLREDLGPALEETARENWEAYASRNGYDIEHVWEEAEGPFVGRDGDGVTLRIEWPGLSALFEFGVEPHTIEGSPLLAFIWEDAPADVVEQHGEDPLMVRQKVNWGSETGGIPESQAIRDALEQFRQEVS
ncbi:hypothetical protein [Salinilacihabitans rarus]|uniref:hypothetical protein n=1 Tax=Salinilacihabitans rarus TaxID=2961596 RepID=UPI0020C9169D|nr:hypothetical protein [Salinilacihabitans rarus]